MRKAILLGLVVCLLSTVAASADIYTDTASFNATTSSPPLGPPIPFTSLDTTGTDQAQLFTNGTAAFGLGSGVNTVGAVWISGATYGNLTGNHPAGGVQSPTGNLYIAIFGVQGTTINPVGSGLATAAFTKGMLEIVQVPNNGTFDPNNPSTWGFGSTPVAVYTLALPATVFPGATPTLSTAGAISTNPSAWPFQLQVDQSLMNQSSVNVTATQSAQGKFLFNQNPGSDLLTTDSGQILPPDLNTADYTQGLLVETEQTVINTAGVPLDAAGETALNNIAMWAFGSDFATFGSGDAGDFTPVVSGGLPVPGAGDSLDFAAQLGVSAYPTLSNVPEPISALVWGGLMGAACWLVGRKRG